MITFVRKFQKYVYSQICLFPRVGKYKLIQGKPGNFNGWTPVPNAESDLEVSPDHTGPQKFPPYQLFNIDGNGLIHIIYKQSLWETSCSLFESVIAFMLPTLKYMYIENHHTRYILKNK